MAPPKRKGTGSSAATTEDSPARSPEKTTTTTTTTTTTSTTNKKPRKQLQQEYGKEEKELAQELAEVEDNGDSNDKNSKNDTDTAAEGAEANVEVAGAENAETIESDSSGKESTTFTVTSTTLSSSIIMTRATGTPGFWGLTDEVISNMKRCREMLECKEPNRLKELELEHNRAQLPMDLRMSPRTSWYGLIPEEKYRKSNILAALSCRVDVYAVKQKRYLEQHRLLPRGLREPAWNRIVDTDTNLKLFSLRNDPDIFLARLLRPEFREKWYPVAAAGAARESFGLHTCQQCQREQEWRHVDHEDSDSDSESESDEGKAPSDRLATVYDLHLINNDNDDDRDDKKSSDNYESGDDNTYEDRYEDDATYNYEREVNHGRPRRLQVPKCLWNDKRVMREVFYYYPEILHQRKRQQEEQKRHTTPPFPADNHLKSRSQIATKNNTNENDRSSTNKDGSGSNLSNGDKSPCFGHGHGCRCQRECPRYCPGCCSFDGCDFSYLDQDQCPFLIDLDKWRDDEDMLRSLLASQYCRRTIQPSDLFFFSKRIRSDPNLMLECFRNIPNRPIYLSKTLRNDKEFWMQRVAVQSTQTVSFLADLSLREVSQRLRADFDVVRAFCRHFDGNNLRIAAYPLRRNLEIMKVACQQTPAALVSAIDESSAKEQLLKTKPFVLQLFQNEDFWDISKTNKSTVTSQQKQQLMQSIKKLRAELLEKLWTQVSLKLQNDIDVVTAYAKVYYRIRIYCCEGKTTEFMAHLPFDKKWLRSLDFCRSIIPLNPSLWSYLDIDLQRQNNDELTFLCARSISLVSSHNKIGFDKYAERDGTEEMDVHGYVSIISLMIQTNPDRAEKLLTDSQVLQSIVSTSCSTKDLILLIGPFISRLSKKVCVDLCRLNIRFYKVLCVCTHGSDPELCRDHDIIAATLECDPSPDNFYFCQRVFTHYFDEHFQNRYPDLVAKYIRAAHKAGYSSAEIALGDLELDEFLHSPSHHCIALACVECWSFFEEMEEYKEDRSIILAKAKTSSEYLGDFLPKSLLADKCFLIQLLENRGKFWLELPEISDEYYYALEDDGEDIRSQETIPTSQELEQDFDLLMAAFVGDPNMFSTIEVNRNEPPELLIRFAKEVRERLLVHYRWITLLVGISSSSSTSKSTCLFVDPNFVDSDSCCWLRMLDQGKETSLALKRLIRDYVGVPGSKEVEKLMSASESLAQWGY